VSWRSSCGLWAWFEPQSETDLQDLPARSREPSNFAHGSPRRRARRNDVAAGLTAHVVRRCAAAS